MILKKFTCIAAVAAIAASCQKDASSLVPTTAITESVTASAVDSVTLITLTNGLVAYYPFNGNANDASGNANHGTLLNGASITYDERGFDSSALNCNGNYDGVRVPNTGKFNFDTAITVSFNVMLRKYGGNSIITFINYANNTAQKLSIGTVNEGYIIAQVANSNAICSTSSGTASLYTSLYPTQIYQLSEHWYNVIFSFNKGVGKIYMNGVLQGTTTFPSSTFNVCSTADLLIGTWAAAGAYGTNGIIDEVRLYNRPLNSDEITHLATYAGK